MHGSTLKTAPEGCKTTRLILGGHSFISQLGNEPPPTEDEQAALVAECLDHGITRIDTTYQPERKAVGRTLEALGCRDRFFLNVWNLFTDFKAGEDMGKVEPYRAHHLDLLLEQLRTDFIDEVVIFPSKDRAEQERQEDLVAGWQEAGLVGMIGTWNPGPEIPGTYREDSPYSFVVQPYNVTTPEAGRCFKKAKELGWETWACSPFVRGWHLDIMVEKSLAGDTDGTEAQVRSWLADQLLRYSLYRPDVDVLVTSIRRREWVPANAASASRGPLTPEEEKELLALA
jgi:aryl-alcohol dehydrogenase-like predicted oxidoreductase